MTLTELFDKIVSFTNPEQMHQSLLAEIERGDYLFDDWHTLASTKLEAYLLDSDGEAESVVSLGLIHSFLKSNSLEEYTKDVEHLLPLVRSHFFKEQTNTPHAEADEEDFNAFDHPEGI